MFFLPVKADPPTLAVDFEVAGTEGNIRLSDYHGKLVYLDFWASWCGPCRLSFPWMQEMHEKYQRQGLAIIAINLDREAVLANQFLSRYAVDFDIGFDPSGKTPRDYGVKGMPYSVVIDQQGVIQATHIGFKPAKQPEYENLIRSLLNQPPLMENQR